MKIVKQIPYRLFIVILLSGLALLGAGCSSDSESADSDEMQELRVWPSLGLIRSPSVSLSHLDGTPISITTGSGSDGSILVSFDAGIQGPLVIEIEGNDTASYFDEASGSFQPFGPGERLRHVLAEPTESAGVTALTEFAALLLDTVPSPTTATIAVASELVRAALGPSLDSIAVAPQMISSTADLARLENTEAGEYAAILAALAKLHDDPASPSPALELVKQLGRDIQDGRIDGLDDNGAAIGDLVYNAATFDTEFTAVVNAVDDGSPLDGHDYRSVSLDIFPPWPRFDPVQWSIDLDAFGPGIHTVWVIADVRNLDAADVQTVYGRLIWDQTEIGMCFADIRDVGSDYLRIGDGFESDGQGDECPANAPMEAAFNDYGLPVAACLSVLTGGVEYEYCAPIEPS